MADPVTTPKGEITLPGIGKVDKKYALGGAAVAVAIVVVVMVRKRSAASAAAAASATPATDTTGADPSIDPATGIPYAEEQADQQAQLASLGGAEGDYGSGVGNLNSGYDAAGYPLGSVADLAWQAQQEGVTTTTGTTTGTAVTTNSQWLTEAEGVLPGDTATIQTALSMVLGGITVTSAQRDLFMEAVGILGNPPGGYPQPIKLSNTAATGTTASGTSSTAPGQVHGLSSSGHTTTTVTLKWSKPSGSVSGYQISYGPNSAGGKPWSTTTTGTSITIGDLKAKTRYYFTVRAMNGATGGPWDTSVGVTTS